MSTALRTPILEGGIRNTHFFQGRLLSAEDLQTEQAANRSHHQQLGRAIGAGVVQGLKVGVDANGSQPSLDITRGLALNAEGQALELAHDVTLTLVRDSDSLPPDTGVFAPCHPQTTTSLLTGAGVYILVMAPASDFRERAPMSGLESNGKTIGCGSRYTVEGVQFRLESFAPLDLPGLSTHTSGLLTSLLGATDAASLSRLRNLLAHLCLGTEEFFTATVDVFARQDGNLHAVRYGALDTLRAAQQLNACDVPLALFYWTPTGIAFLDVWSARRSPYPMTPTAAWPTRIYARFQAEAEALLFQFQEHFAEVHTQSSSRLQVEEQFVYLPPAGFLPRGTPGVDWRDFLGVHAPRTETLLDEGLARAVIANALTRAPVQVVARTSSTSAEDVVPFHIYRIVGHADAVLFSRSAFAEVVAKDVSIDNSVCNLPGAVSVQDALDELCRKVRSCCTIVVAAQPNWEQVFTQLTPGQDVEVCFEVGHFDLAQPLSFSGLGHVRVIGAGSGTRLRANARETSLSFVDCASVQISHLSAEASMAGAGPSGLGHLNGVLNFVNCPIVDVSDTVLRCAAGNQPASSCIGVRNKTLSAASREKSSTRVRGCALSVGRNQVGVLVVDVARTQIEDNILHLLSGEAPASQGIVVGGAFAQEVRILNNSLHDFTQGIHIGTSRRGSRRVTPNSAQQVMVIGNTVHITLATNSRRERHAIFIGNCQSLVVQNNYAELRRLSPAASQVIDGLRLFGYFGRRLLVRGNHFERFNVGILLNPVEEPAATPSVQWVVDDNLAVGAAQVVKVVPTSLRSRVRGVSNNFA